MKNVLKPLAKSVLIPLRLSSAASATDAVIQKRFLNLLWQHESVSKEEMDDIIMDDEFRLLIKCVRETIKNEAKQQKVGFLDMLLATLGASFIRKSIKRS